ERPTDAIVRLTVSAICGTDLHFVRGTMPSMIPGTILGHEGVGVVEEVGKDVRNLLPGDRVVIPSTIGCGACSYCRAGYYAQCDVANPNGPQAGTAFFGGPKDSGPFNGMQAEAVCVPFANVGPVKLPDEVSDDQAILLSDIFPTGYFGADLADIKPGHTVAVFGCGPVGQFAITAAFMMGAGRVFAVDTVPGRLAMAAAQGAEIVDFNKEDPVQALRDMTNGVGPDRVIDAVGVDAVRPQSGPAAAQARKDAAAFEEELERVAPERKPHDVQWTPGDAPSQALRWATQAVAKGGTVAIIGVYPLTHSAFPIGAAMNRNLTLRMGNCNHRKYLWKAVSWVKNGTLSPERILTELEPIAGAIEAYEAFDTRQPGWIKVALDPTKQRDGREVATAATPNGPSRVHTH
ncbi:MAG: alcohol dehydrogenase catalytic domain-containing protein, partial [Candidatus Eremiobacteraeota bacterium]|nr:alcohol dehydrogenase catalytic domain-containing protein [Candidatus Eremiobacteraeota bacterium]